jgi:hypothetical protein
MKRFLINPLIGAVVMVSASAGFPSRLAAQEPESPKYIVRSWEVSQAIPVEKVQMEKYPSFFAIFFTDWQVLEADDRGLVDISEGIASQSPSGDLVMARHVFQSDEDRGMDFSIGYSDEVALFFNGHRVIGERTREEGSDPSSAGILDLHQEAQVQVRKGLNEVFLLVTGKLGAWGFKVQVDQELSPKTTDHTVTEEVWKTADVFLTPESVLKDPTREVLYVTNFDVRFASKSEPSGFLSRLSMDGEILDLHWVEGLNAPTGMDIWEDTLFLTERKHLVAIDLETGSIAGRWPIPDPIFPNDLVIDDDGTLYISDTRSGNPTDSRIYRFREGSFDVFANAGIDRANGLWIHEGWLIVGNSGDGMLKRVDLTTGKIEAILSLGAGIIDGIRVDEEGNLLVSHWEGRVYRISSAGELVEILDAGPRRWNTADFEYLEDENLLLVPTFTDNRVRAVRVAR